MAELIEIGDVKERVILLAVETGAEDAAAALDELEELVDTAGAVAVDRVIQNREKIHPGTYLGKGKIDEVKERIWELNATGVVLSWLLPMLYQAAGVEQMTQIPQGGYAANMEGAELIVFLMGIAVWGIIAIGTTCGAVGVYIAICKINHRWDYVKHMFSQGTRERLFTVSLVPGMLIAFAYMGFSIYLERM